MARWNVDLNKLKKDLQEKGIEKGKEELEKLKGRMGNFNSGNVSTASTSPEQQTETEPEADTGQNAGQIATSGRENTMPVMDSGKAPVREPETPRREEEIREPGSKKDEQNAVSAQGQESAREAAIEENPASDEADDSEEAA
jgi:hypothetical protein